MKNLFSSDSFLMGFICSLLANVFAVLLIRLGIWLANVDVWVNFKLFLFSVVPSIFLLRYYATEQKSHSMKGSALLMIIYLVGMIIGMYSMNMFDGAFNWRINL